MATKDAYILGVCLFSCLMKSCVPFSVYRAGTVLSGLISGFYFSLWCLLTSKHVLNLQMEGRGFIQNLGCLGANS